MLTVSTGAARYKIIPAYRTYSSEYKTNVNSPNTSGGLDAIPGLLAITDTTQTLQR